MGSGLFQPMHLLIILVVVILIFGPGRLGNIGKDLGKSIKDFKKAMSDEDVTPKEEAAAQPAQQIPPSQTAQTQATGQAAQTAQAAQPGKDATHG